MPVLAQSALPARSRWLAWPFDLTGKTQDFIHAAGWPPCQSGIQILTQLSVEANLGAAGALLTLDARLAELAHTCTVILEMLGRSRTSDGIMSGGRLHILATDQTSPVRPWEEMDFRPSLSAGAVPPYRHNLGLLAFQVKYHPGRYTRSASGSSEA
jgi:hypothetical protein